MYVLIIACSNGFASLTLNLSMQSLAAVVDENSIFLAVLNIIRNLSCDVSACNIFDFLFS